MKIAMLNTWGKSGPYPIRFELILKEIHRVKPDILCLQEVFESELAERIKFETELQHVHAFHEVGLVILGRLPFDCVMFDKYKAKSPLEDYSRGYLSAQQTSNGQKFWVGNTHLSWKAEDAESRTKQILELLDVVQSLNAPCILTGDFNTTPDSEPIAKLKNAGFVDLCEMLRPNQTLFTWDNKRNPYLKTHTVIFPNRRIDLLMASKSFVSHYIPSSYELCFNYPDTEGNFPSDHFGVVAEFSI